MTQDCELDLDYKARYERSAAHRLIDSVLLCDVDDAEQMRQRGSVKSSRAWEVVKINQNERYHLLGSVPVEIAERQASTSSQADSDAIGAGSRRGVGWRRWLEYLRPQRVVPAPRPLAAGRAGHLAPGFRGTLGLDFRDVFTMPMPELLRRIEIGEAVRHCYLSPTYRDNLSNRFYGYHMRVALPEGEE
jgi:hypothetical protein